MQRRRRSLQAAHGVMVFSTPPCNSDDGGASKSRFNLLLDPSSCLESLYALEMKLVVAVADDLHPSIIAREIDRSIDEPCSGKLI